MAERVQSITPIRGGPAENERAAFHRKLLRRWPGWFLVICLAIVSVQMIVNGISGQLADGDCGGQFEFGRRFLAGEPLYAQHETFQYLPIAALYWSPLALLGPHVGPLVRYAMSVACLGWTFWMLAVMVRPQCDPSRWDALTLVGVSVFLGLHYLLRDLVDAGPHVILLTMLVGGIYCAWRGREKLAGVWFGLAIVLKLTPGLFLPFLLWKRKWQLAAYTLVAMLLWTVLPIVRMGPASWWKHQRAWNAVALSVFLDRPHPDRVHNETRIINQALKPAIERYLVTYPPGHPLRLDHPADRPVLDLSPATAKQVANLIMLSLVLGFAWWSRRRYTGPDDPAWLVESSGVLILALLLAPLAWVQHIVFALPAIYLIVARDWAIRKLPWPAMIAIGAYIVLTLLLNRELLGLRNYAVLLSYHIHTMGLLILLGLLMILRPTDRPAITNREHRQLLSGLKRAA
jgi:hypothetical protein